MRFFPAIAMSLLFGCATPEDLDTGAMRADERAPAFSHNSEANGEEACYPGDQAHEALCLPLEPLNGVESDYRYPETNDPQYVPPTAYIDLLGTNENAKLSENLKLTELAASHKGRWAVIQPHLIENLQAIRNELGPIVIESGYRSPRYNRSVGGAVLSRHQYGDAVDIWAMKAGLEAVRDACIAHGATYVEVYRGHVHCDWRDMPLDSSFFGEKYTPEADQGDPNQVRSHNHGHPHQPVSENEEVGGPIETFTF